MNAPDPGWIDFLKLAQGVVIILMLGILATIIGLGKVEQQTSHGLDIILGAIAVLSGQFSQWAFSGGKS